MPDPTISVVIPAWNRAATIGRCLRSVQQQTLQPHEIIVVDDGSTDETIAIARAAGDSRLRVIELQRGGAQRARNEGIRAATGEWIAFLDSDDEWRPDKLALQVEALRSAGFDPFTVVHGNALRIDSSSGAETINATPGVDGADVYATMLTRSGALYFPALLVSKAALERIGYLDERVVSYQEWDTAIRLARFCRFIYLPEPLFTYHVHGGETISRDDSRSIDGYAYIAGKYETEIKRVCGEDVWSLHVRYLAARCMDAALWDRAGGYLRAVTRRGWRYRALQLCRYLHVRPSRVARLIGR